MRGGALINPVQGQGESSEVISFQKPSIPYSKITAKS